MSVISPEFDLSIRLPSYNGDPESALKVFDINAPIKMMRADVADNGYIRAETKTQILDEQLTYVAEAIDSAHVSKFELYYDHNLGLKDVMGRSMMDLLQNGVIAADQKVCQDGRNYVYTRAVQDYLQGEKLEAMMASDNSNVLVSFSPFPQEAYGEYGKTIEDDGFQPKRLLGFIYVYTKKSDGVLEVTTMTVDNCDLAVVREMASKLGIAIDENEVSDNYLQFCYQDNISEHDSEQLPAKVLGIYDQIHKKHFGVEVKAGRPIVNEPDAWEFVSAQTDLIERYYQRLENLASTEGDVDASDLTYEFWATINSRLKKWKPASEPKVRSTTVEQSSMPQHILDASLARRLDTEMRQASFGARSRGEQPVGCGGSIRPGSGLGDPTDNGPDSVRDKIFSDKAESKSSWKWKKGVCVVTKCSTRPGETEVGPCSICKDCQGKFDKGIDPTK